VSIAAVARQGRAGLAPALLTDASWYGTLAAARDLGQHGVPVTLASDVWLAPARWSRHVTRTVACPPPAEAGRFLEWLHSFAAREPGHVYAPTSDDTAWLVAAHRASLERDLRLDLPPLEAFAALLDKARLAEAAEAVGLATPRIWLPQDEGEVERLARELPFPLLVKPRTQVLAGGVKGRRVPRREDLLPAWRAVRDAAAVHPEVARHAPQAGAPLLQAHHGASEGVFTVDGFVGAGADAFVAIGCTKLIQLPRGSGPGLVFEPAPVEPSLADGLLRLFRRVGYVGVFDAEFVAGDREGEWLLIDLNPRFYNHMAYEVDRGVRLPWMAYCAAAGLEEEGQAELRAARAAAAAPPTRVYAHRRQLALLLAVQRLGGGMSAAEVKGWRAWLARHRREVTDPSVAEGDGAPGLIDSLYIAHRLARHPRAGLRGLLR
jgi:predicted ATP-grasp superfamily ATP-dependent carboligase